MAATSVITIGERAGTIIAVPSAAVQRIGSAWVVFVPREEGLYEIRQIGRGRDIGGEVEILSGLKAGETIVVNGAFLLKAEAEKARGQGDPHGHGE
jgi:cobalt-zinc-cadmium efflux system membrane fusion protein